MLVSSSTPAPATGIPTVEISRALDAEQGVRNLLVDGVAVAQFFLVWLDPLRLPADPHAPALWAGRLANETRPTRAAIADGSMEDLLTELLVRSGTVKPELARNLVGDAVHRDFARRKVA